MECSYEKILPLLECPESRSPLELASDGLLSSGNQTKYPFIQGVPWLLRSPQSQWLQWQNRLRYKWLEWEGRCLRITQEIADKGLSSKTQARLEAVRSGYEVNLRTTQALFSDVIASAEMPKELAQFAGEKVPSNQISTSYFQNIFRDWVWGENEHKSTLECLRKVAPQHWGKTLVCGAGAGRLVADIAQNFQPDLLAAVDINPLLLTIARVMCQGEQSLTLSEFPVAPIDIASAAPIHTFRGTRVEEDIFWLYGDGMNLPIRTEAMDTVLTPWFIDIIPQDFNEFAKSLNRVLKPGGTWLNMGPLGFQNTEFFRRYSREEILLSLESSGFEVRVDEVFRVPYLQSPHNGHWRLESVLCFQAVKVRHCDEPKEFQYLPHWLVNLDAPIPKTKEIIQAISQHTVYFEILSAIDGVRSIHGIADAMAQHYRMERSLALESLLGFLVRNWEQELYRQ